MTSGVKTLNMATGFMSIFAKLEKYDGKDDLATWFKKFERCCTLANKVEDNVKGQLVMLCLEGQALAVAEQLDGETDGELLLTAVRQRLETVFDTTAIREQKMASFENRRQKLDESEDEFMLSLTTYYRGANPTATAAELNKAVKRKFMQGISEDLRRAIYVFISDPFAITVTHRRLLEAARNAKLSLLGSEETIPSAPTINSVTPTSISSPAAPSNADVMVAINALTQSVGEVVNAVSAFGRGSSRGNSSRRGGGQNRGRGRNNNNNNNNNNNTSGNNNNRTITCFKCGGPNHRARDCTLN